MKETVTSNDLGDRLMDLREYLLNVARTYDRRAPMNSDAQRLLRTAKEHLRDLTPAGYRVRGSGGMGTPTFTPWIGVFHPDETDDPGQGLYIVYLFAEDLTSVTLMLNQGVTRLSQELAGHSSRQEELKARLRRDAESFRHAVPAVLLKGWDTSVDLGSKGWRQRAYEAGSVVARRYNIEDLPSEAGLRADLWRLADIYQRAIESRDTPVVSRTDVAVLDPGSYVQPEESADPLRDFYPKDDADYVAHLVGRRIRKKRRHETLIAEFGPALAGAGFRVTTDVHPRDLMLHRGGASWLVEAKVVYNGNATAAVREAVGQLLSYRHFLHPDPPAPRLVALFTETVGEGYAAFLEALGIAVVWKGPGGWEGSAAAVEDGLVPVS
ncbi:MrcB family domain-containing protein [Kitasatospora sp. NPDC058184]|uniref:MrcB family domain-containing protein n=1 Tax=Kitasatospora sp. NPDC058184 TaxID=3346370 RepID=UPI0036DD9956